MSAAHGTPTSLSIFIPLWVICLAAGFALTFLVWSAPIGLGFQDWPDDHSLTAILQHSFLYLAWATPLFVLLGLLSGIVLRTLKLRGSTRVTVAGVVLPLVLSIAWLVVFETFN